MPRRRHVGNIQGPRTKRARGTARQATTSNRSAATGNRQPVSGNRSAAIGYHLAECLRYVDRGLGCFADSDGMYLQLAYLADFGVLAPSIPGSPKLTVDVDGILAGLRSLARVLADTVLAGDVAATLALAKAYGPTSANPALGPFLAARSSELPVSLDYQQPALTCTEFPLLT